MFTIIADVAVLGIIGYCGLLGYSRGMRPAVVVALEQLELREVVLLEELEELVL